MQRKRGLTTKDAKKIMQLKGYNNLPQIKKTFMNLVLKRLIGPIPYIIELALIIELILGNYIQVIFIFALLLFSAIDGSIQEKHAKESIGELNTKLVTYVSVLRDGKWKKLSSREIVPGDWIHLAVGSIVPADGKIIKGEILVNQSVITGESKAIIKNGGDNLYSGSTLIQGNCNVLVEKIGKDSSLGKTSELVRVNESPGRLEKLLFTVVKYLAYLDIVLAIVLTISAVIRKMSLLSLLPFLVILFVATIPISMPSSFSVANSIEAGVLSKKGILVSGLSGIQEAGSMNVLLMDKTGTITQNKPVLNGIVSLNGMKKSLLLKYALATVSPESINPLDLAIVQEATLKNIMAPNIKEQISFDPVLKGARAILDDGREVFLGSPTKINISDEIKKQIIILSKQGLQIMALAIDQKIIGILTFEDPIKTDIPQIIVHLKQQGITVLMLTGDTETTAQSIAKKIGLNGKIGSIEEAMSMPLSYSGFANVYPKDKLKIVKLLQDKGYVVGMTGDGINDAPALKQADVGIAINTATDISKLASRIILTKSSLIGITELVDSGHRVYQRMMTWLITKLARTAQLSLLITFGYLFTNFFPLSLNIIVFIVIFNDCVTLTLGSDRVKINQFPEKWDLVNLLRVSAIYVIGWLPLGFLILWYSLYFTNFNHSQISGMLFVYLIYSAMGMILSTRTRNHFWSIPTGRAVGIIICCNVLISTMIAIFGLSVGVINCLVIFLICILIFFGLDYIKVAYYS